MSVRGRFLCPSAFERVHEGTFAEFSPTYLRRRVSLFASSTTSASQTCLTRSATRSPISSGATSAAATASAAMGLRTGVPNTLFRSRTRARVSGSRPSGSVRFPKLRSLPVARSTPPALSAAAALANGAPSRSLHLCHPCTLPARSARSAKWPIQFPSFFFVSLLCTPSGELIGATSYAATQSVRICRLSR